MQEEELNKILKGFDTVLKETYTIKKQNKLSNETIDTIHGNVRVVSNQIVELEDYIKRLQQKINSLEHKVESLERKIR